MQISRLLQRVRSDKKILTAVIVAAAVLFILDVSFLFKLQWNFIKSVNKKASVLRKDLAKLNKSIAVLEAEKGRKLQEASAKAKQLISRDEMPTLLNDISQIASAHRVRIVQIKPQADKKGKTVGKQPLVLLRITLDMSCGYHALGAFLSALENAKTFTELDSLTINSNTLDYFTHDVTLVLRTYAKK